MTTFSVDMIAQWLVQFFIPFFRIAAFFATVPVFGNQLVPQTVRLSLALVVALLIAPLVSISSPANLFSLPFFLSIFQQILIGVSLGFLVQIFFHIFVFLCIVSVLE